MSPRSLFNRTKNAADLLAKLLKKHTLLLELPRDQSSTAKTEPGELIVVQILKKFIDIQLEASKLGEPIDIESISEQIEFAKKSLKNISKPSEIWQETLGVINTIGQSFGVERMSMAMPPASEEKKKVPSSTISTSSVTTSPTLSTLTLEKKRRDSRDLSDLKIQHIAKNVSSHSSFYIINDKKHTRGHIIAEG